MAETPPFEIQSQTEGDRLVFKIVGEINFQTGAKLREEVKRCLEMPVTDIVLDLAKVSFMDSSGIGTLIGLKTTCQVHEKRLRLVNPQEPVRESLEVMHIDKIFGLQRREASEIPGLSSS